LSVVFTQPGSFPDVDAPKREVRFAPINGHPQRDGHVRLSANSGLVHRSK